MSRLTQATSFILLILLSELPLYAQEIQKAKPDDNPAQASAERSAAQKQQRLLALLDHLLETSGGFEDAHLKIMIQAEAADLLWPYDAERARRMFEEAFRDVDGMKLTHLEADAAMKSPYIASIKSRLRTELLRMISGRDRAMAERLAKSIEPAQANDSESLTCAGCSNQSESDTQQMMLAVRAVATAPARAAQLAKEGLSKGINPMIRAVLHELRRKDPALADDLFTYALSVAQRQRSTLSESVGALYNYVLPDFGEGILQPVAALKETTPPNPALVAEFLNLVHDAILREAEGLQAREANAAPLSSPRIAMDYFIGEQMLPYFDRYMPDKTAAVRARLDEIIRAIPAEAATKYLTEYRRDRTPEAFLNEAKTEPSAEKQQSLYQEAILHALNAQDYEQALATVAKLDDETARSYWDMRVRSQRAMRALNNRELDAAYVYANEVPELSGRMLALGRIALQAFYQKDTARAAQVLAEAEALLPKAENSVEKARSALDLVYVSAQIDLNHGFANMQSAVEVINTAGFSTHWVDFRPVISRKTGKRLIGTEVGLGGLHFTIAFERLGRKDFDRSLQLAQMIAPKEASVMAQLGLCRIALGDLAAAKPQETVVVKSRPGGQGETHQQR